MRMLSEEKFRAQKIRRLSEATINQIAAGEVVEGASSIVKELLENALDAGATSLEIETKGGGRQLIRVSDDGVGMSPEDLELAPLRHATSKLEGIEDLERLGTFGFRGEALAAICGVAKVKIHTAQETGYLLTVVGGQIESCRAQARRRGTTVEVEALFFNVPARRKFQKSIASESAALHQVITQVALAFPHIHLRWVHEEKEVFNLPAAPTVERRLTPLLGEEFAPALSLRHARGRLFIEGYLAEAHHHRSKRSGLHFFVANRPIRSPLLAEAVVEGFATRLPPRRYPLGLLFLRLPPELVDVNVHPQKSEVRFAEEGEIRSFVREAVERALQQRERAPPSAPLSFTPAPFTQALPPSPKEEAPLVQAQFFGQETSFKLLHSSGSYLLIERGGALYLVDTEAAYARLFLEQMERKRLPEITPLLHPLTVELTRKEALCLESHLEELSALGMAIRPLSGNSFAIDALPTLVKESAVKELLVDLAAHFSTKKEQIGMHLVRHVPKRVKSQEEGRLLVQQLFALPSGTLYWKGRPLYVEVTLEEMQRLFERSI